MGATGNDGEVKMKEVNSVVDVDVTDARKIQDELFARQMEEKINIKSAVAHCYSSFIDHVYDICREGGVDNDELIENAIYHYVHWVSHPVIPPTPLANCFAGSGDTNEVNDLGKRGS